MYNLVVVSIPPHRPRRRRDHPPRIFLSREYKLAAIAMEVREYTSTAINDARRVLNSRACPNGHDS